MLTCSKAHLKQYQNNYIYSRFLSFMPCVTHHMSPYVAEIKMLFQLLQFLKLLSRQLLPSAHLERGKAGEERGGGDVLLDLCRFHGD